jgi:hypothetical protein
VILERQSMPEDRDWLWPWEKDPNWVQGPADNGLKGSGDADDETEKSSTASAGDNKDPAKKPPQYTLSSAEIVVPDKGLIEGQPYRFKGKMRRLEGAAPSGEKISVQAVYRYKKEEQICGNPVTAEINKDTLDFEGKFDELFEPNAYHLDKDKPVGAKYILVLKFRGECLDKDGFSKEVELPMTTKDSNAILIMRKGQKVPFYYQLDERWKSEILGKKRTIGQAGCCISCLAMILKFFGRDVNPKNLDEYLDSNSGYEGDVVYFDVALKYKEGSEEKLSYKGNRVASGFTSILDDRIKNNIPTIARVKYGTSKSSGGDHFVVIIGKTADGKYIMNDPGASDGNGAENPISSNIVNDTKRKSGYMIIGLDCITATLS